MGRLINAIDLGLTSALSAVVGAVTVVALVASVGAFDYFQAGNSGLSRESLRRALEQGGIIGFTAPSAYRYFKSWKEKRRTSR
jgi:hypothetical protein